MPGVRVVKFTSLIVERVFEEGVERCVPLEPLSFKVIDARADRDRGVIELLVQSASFPEDEASACCERGELTAAWNKAVIHPPSSFKRWTDDMSIWCPRPDNVRAVRFYYDVGGGVRYEADLPEGTVEVCGVDLSEPPEALVRRERGLAGYERLPLRKVSVREGPTDPMIYVREVAPSEPEEGPPV